MQRRRALLAVSLILTAGVSQAATWHVYSDTRQAQLVELFTSEGCSSCPPADGWLSSLKTQPQLFRSVVPVAYHVTYWDYLGWEDTLGLPAHDARHRSQAAFANSAVYTPGVFLQGREWRSWRRHPEGPMPAAADEVGELRAEADNGRIQVTFTPAPGIRVNAPEVFVTYLRMNETTQVRAGENRGRELTHDFVAGAVARERLQLESGVWQVTLPEPPAQDADAVAVWVKQADGTLLQASGGYLPSGSS